MTLAMVLPAIKSIVVPITNASNLSSHVSWDAKTPGRRGVSVITPPDKGIGRPAYGPAPVLLESLDPGQTLGEKLLPARADHLARLGVVRVAPLAERGALFARQHDQLDRRFVLLDLLQPFLVEPLDHREDEIVHLDQGLVQQLLPLRRQAPV